ncbi:MAG: L-rhamnose 1-epimerase [Candidatus Marinimicrobia bacterium]|nr:L-rhamnose 1-epimerase [Candidatus Neomarinimicrobiota bacterium]|tara:strand:+ start:2149 stop:2610 length:462 start_codon:yes stop_codon:yes gene_type:complete
MKNIIVNNREKIRIIGSLQLIIVLLAGLFIGCESNTVENSSKNNIKRVGMVIKIKPEYIEEYKVLHASSNPGVRDLLSKANMHNFSIFLHQLDDGNWYEFGYYEYTGNDFKADMEELSKHPRNIEWLKICDPMQVPLNGYEGWAEMEQVYYNK